MSRLNSGQLTRADLRLLQNTRPSTKRWPGYISDEEWTELRSPQLWSDHFPAIPFPIIDPRIFKIARSFWQNPADKLRQAYARLEDEIRYRFDSNEHGTKLFAQAFAGANPKLVWPGALPAEQQGRAQLFIGSYMAFRNRRAHRELLSSSEEEYMELLLLNMLFKLERQAVLSEAEVAANGKH